MLDALDRRLEEVGRRDHRFAWLRDAGGELVPLLAYYPGRRVAVAGAVDDPGQLETFRALAADHDLVLVAVGQEELSGDPGRVATAIAATIPARAVRSTAQTHVGRGDRRSAPAPPSRAADPPSAFERRESQSEAEGFWLGIVLLLVAGLECYLGFVVIGIGAGDLVLGFGFVLDAGARVAGMVASVVTGDSDGAWGRVLAGSPALWGIGDETAAASRAATVARMISWLAGGVLALGLLLAIL